MIGAVFAVVLYFALRSGLVQLTTTGGDNSNGTGAADLEDQVYFYATLAFVAGFSERKARVLLGGATKTLGGGDDDEHPPDKPPPTGKKPANGSTA